jgi:tetratricopeptide (TPR) repeat protein
MRNRLSFVFVLVALLCVSAVADSAQQLLSEGRADDAIHTLAAEVKTNPNDAQAWNLLSRAYLSVQQWDAAISASQKAVSLGPSVSAYHLWLGRAYGHKAEHSSWLTAISLAKKVHNEFELAVRLQPSSVEAQADLAEFYLDAPSFLGGGRDKAEQQASRLASLNAPTSHWIKAQLAEKDKHNDDAEREYRAAIAAGGNQANSWLDLASFYRRVGRLKDMEDAIQHAVSTDHATDSVLFEAAQLLFRAGRNFPAAVQLTRTYLSSSDKSESAPAFQAHYLLGSLYEKLGDTKSAADEYRAALALASNFSPAHDALRRVSGD